MGGSGMLMGMAASSQVYWVDICLIVEYGKYLYSKLIRLAGVNDYAGCCRFPILGSVSRAIYLVDVRKISNSTVIPLKARKQF